MIGTYVAHRTGPPPGLLSELGSSSSLIVEQRWRPDSAPEESVDEDADFIVYVRDDVILPSRFLDTLVSTQIALDVDRLQPTHIGGPEGGPPVAERHMGSVGREIDEVTSVPVLSVRAGATRTGSVTLTDSLSVGLREPLPMRAPGDAFVRRIWILDPDRRPVAYVRPEPATAPGSAS